MPKDFFDPVSLAIGAVLLQESVRMIFPGSRRLGILIGAVALLILSARVTVPLATAYIGGHSSAIDSRLFHGWELPPPKTFFSTTIFAAGSVAAIVEYLKDRRLRTHILQVVDDIQGFRFETDAKRPVLVRHPQTGQINLYQAQAVMEFQKRQHSGFIAKFRHPLDELATEIARTGISSTSEMAKKFIGTQDIRSVEGDLLEFADQVGEPNKALSWRIARSAFLLMILPTIIWTSWAVVIHANS